MPIKKIIIAGVISAFLMSNALVISPMSLVYGLVQPGDIEPAEPVEPLGAVYTKPGSEHIHTDQSTWQHLTVPEIEPVPSILDVSPEAVSIKIELNQLTTENTWKLSDEEYFKIVSENRSYDVLKSIELAYADVGNTYPTGWSMRGECIMSVAHWTKSAGVTWGEGGSPVKNFSTATRIPLENLQAGDVIQYVNLATPHEWAQGVHTVLITGNNWDGTYRIVESNVVSAGLVSKNDSWVPKPPAGFEAAAFRF